MPEPALRRPSVVTETFALDLRSLALLRIALGTILLCDLAIRAGDLQIFYAETGLLTLRDSIRHAGAGCWSLYWLSTDVRYAASLFALSAVAAIGLMIGWRTTVMTVACWVLNVSLQNRNILVINGGDIWLRLLLMWGVFIPWGTVWSVDARRAAQSGIAPPEKLCFTPGTVCLVLQTALVYFFGGLLKINERWLGFNPWDALMDGFPAGATLGGDAIQRAFSYIAYSRPAAMGLLQFPALLRFISFGTPFFEFLLAAAVLYPGRNRRIRLWAVIAAAAFHFGIEAFLHVGQFSFVALAAWLSLLPSCVWDERGWRRFFPWHPSVPVAALIEPRPRPGGRTPAVCCALLMCLVLYWNFAGLFRKDIRNSLRGPVQPVANSLLLRQNWNMFSRPHADQSRFLYAGELPDGRLVDALHSRPLTTLDLFPFAESPFPNHRWRKLHATLEESGYARTRRRMAAALRERWNAAHSPDERLVRVTMYRYLVSATHPSRPPRRTIAAAASDAQ